MQTASSAHRDVQRVAVGLGVDGDGGDAHAPCRLDDPAGDLAPIGHKDLVEHARPARRRCLGGRRGENKRSVWTTCAGSDRTFTALRSCASLHHRTGQESGDGRRPRGAPYQGPNSPAAARFSYSRCQTAGGARHRQDSRSSVGGDPGSRIACLGGRAVHSVRNRGAGRRSFERSSVFDAKPRGPRQAVRRKRRFTDGRLFSMTYWRPKSARRQSAPRRSPPAACNDAEGNLVRLENEILRKNDIDERVASSGSLRHAIVAGSNNASHHLEHDAAAMLAAVFVDRRHLHCVGADP